MAEDIFKNKLILVVDDEERMSRFIRLNLEHDGFQVIEANRGMQAIQLYSGSDAGSCSIRYYDAGSGWI